MHIVVIGAGDIGSYIATLLSREDHDVTVIDKDKKKLEQLSMTTDVATRVGNATDWQLLDSLIEFYPDLLISVTDNDEANLVACSIGKHLGYPTTIARLQDNKLLNRTRLDFAKIFDVDYFISPEQLVAYDILKYMASEGSILVEHFAHGAVQLRTLLIPKTWRLGNKELKQLDLPNGVMVGLIRRKEGPHYRLIFPHGEDVIMPGDEVTFIGETEAVIALHHYFDISQNEVRSVMIGGGSTVGLQLARLLERRQVSVQLVEKDYDKCITLAESLPHTTIIHHDVQDIEFLKAQKVSEIGLFVACMRHDDANLTAGLMAKEAGCRDAVAVLSDTRNTDFATRLGINHVLSPRISAANRVLSQIFTGSVTSLVSLYENQAEVLEVNVSSDSQIVGIPLSDLGPLLPKDLLIAMIQNRGRVTVANGNRIISPGDTVIVITDPKHIAELEKIF